MLNLFLAFDDPTTPLIIAGVVAVIIIILLAFFPTGTWFIAAISGARVSMGRLVGMKMRRIRYKMLVDVYIRARKAGLNIDIGELESHVMAGGNENVILCERGVRTFETFTRNTLDLSAIPAVKKLSHLPVIVDPSHAAGLWWMVEPLAKAAVAVGADGLIIEVHHNPECAMCDGAQSLYPWQYDLLYKQC